MFKKHHIVTTSAIISLILSNASYAQAEGQSTLELHNNQLPETEIIEDEAKEVQSSESTLNIEDFQQENPNELPKETKQQFNQIIQELNNILDENQRELLNIFLDYSTNPNSFKRAVVYHANGQFEEAKDYYDNILEEENTIEFSTIINALIEKTLHKINILEINKLEVEEVEEKDTNPEYGEQIDSEITESDKAQESESLIDESNNTYTSEESLSFTPMMTSIVPSADELSNSITHAKYAYQAWDDALLYESLYPEDSRLQKSLDTAANYMLNQAIKNHQNNNFSTASEIYNKVLTHDNVSTNLFNVMETLMNHSLASNSFSTADELYNSVQNAKYAYQAWDDAILFSRLYSHDSRLQVTIDTAAGFMLRQGEKSHERKDYTNAVSIYNKILEGRISNYLSEPAKAYLSQASESQTLTKADDLYHSIQNAKFAYVAWEEALYMRVAFPSDARVQTVIDTAAGYMLRQGEISHERKDYANAISIYNKILEGRISNYMSEPARAYLNQAIENEKLTKAEDLYDSVQNAKFAYVAWDEALYMKNAFPSDARVQATIDTAGGYMLRQGKISHERKDFSNAISIYSKILEDGMSNYLSEPTRAYLNQATESRTITTADDLYHSVQNAKFAYVAWGEALYMKDAFPTDKRMQGSVDTAAGYMLNQAVKSHTQNRFQSAMETYKKIYSEDLVSNHIRTRAESYHYLASNNYSLSNVIVRNTSYNINIEDFISTQMTRNPQIWDTSTSSKDPWRSATRSETARFADPERVNHNSEYLQFLMLSESSGISARDLNEELKNSGILAGLGSVFQKASSESNVNELYLIAHALLETGNGTSQLAKGIKVNGKTVYNMFGIGAIDKNANKYGSAKAYEMGWFTPQEAILGGAKWISQNYVNSSVYNQNTLYKMRWNPASPGLHQYATDVAWAYTQTKKLDSMVELTQKYNGLLNFDVPNFK